MSDSYLPRVRFLEPDVLNWFRYHPATEITGPQHDDVRLRFRELAGHLLDALPDGPDKTLALRKLQEAMMSANACIANNQTDDQPQRNPHSGTTDPDRTDG